MKDNPNESITYTSSTRSGNGTWTHLMARAHTESHLLLPGLIALINGWWHKLKFRMLGKKVKIGKAFRVYGSFRIIGTGGVKIGDDCFVNSILIKPVTFMTAYEAAKITIGNHAGFSGTTIQCSDDVFIGDWCNIADAYIVDSSAHVLSADRRFVSIRYVPKAPVAIEENVWISTHVVITKGVKIHKNSVIGACSLVRKDVPKNSFYAGNPLRFIKKVPDSVDELKEGKKGTSF